MKAFCFRQPFAALRTAFLQKGAGAVDLPFVEGCDDFLEDDLVFVAVRLDSLQAGAHFRVGAGQRFQLGPEGFGVLAFRDIAAKCDEEAARCAFRNAQMLR
ncbi:hypothetical protein ACM64Y_09370 [Novispirillum sp. DQ9]|uniref:hypothetical protein n=1 Tax=Novispirillum sp. DQ9 TaxID=3398612 RepID=UPI003C7A1B88